VSFSTEFAGTPVDVDRCGSCRIAKAGIARYCFSTSAKDSSV
jgi:hypothetical protein